MLPASFITIYGTLVAIVGDRVTVAGGQNRLLAVLPFCLSFDCPFVIASLIYPSFPSLPAWMSSGMPLSQSPSTGTESPKAAGLGGRGR